MHNGIINYEIKSRKQQLLLLIHVKILITKMYNVQDRIGNIKNGICIFGAGFLQITGSYLHLNQHLL